MRFSWAETLTLSLPWLSKAVNGIIGPLNDALAGTQNLVNSEPQEPANLIDFHEYEIPKIDYNITDAVSEQSACQNAEVLSREIGTWDGYRNLELACAAAPDESPDEWLSDTGASKSLIGRCAVGENFLRSSTPSYVSFATANGTTESKERVCFDLAGEGTGPFVKPQVLESSPSAISVGEFRQQQIQQAPEDGGGLVEFGFWWPPSSWNQPAQYVANPESGPVASYAYNHVEKENAPFLCLPLSRQEVATYPATGSVTALNLNRQDEVTAAPATTSNDSNRTTPTASIALSTNAQELHDIMNSTACIAGP